jgi:hypothetical protein
MVSLRGLLDTEKLEELQELARCWRLATFTFSSDQRSGSGTIRPADGSLQRWVR